MPFKLPQRLTTRQTALLAFLLVAALALFVVVVVPKLFPATAETSSVISIPMRQLKTKFDLSILEDPRFKALRRVSQIIDPASLKSSLGRTDPFAPVAPAPLERSSGQPLFPRFR